MAFSLGQIMGFIKGDTSQVTQPNGQLQPQPQQQNIPTPPQPDPNNPANLNYITPGANALANPPGTTTQPGPVQKSPIDQLTELFNNPPKPEGKPEDDPANFFKVDQKALGETIGKIDFTQGLTPELLQKFQGEDNQALLQLVNAVARNAVLFNTNAANKLVEQGTTHMSSHLTKNLPKQIMQQNVSESLVAANPYAKPFANILVQNLAQANPNANPSDLQKQASDLLESFAQSVVQQHQSTQDKQAQSDGDNPSKRAYYENEDGSTNFLKLFNME